MKNEFHPGLLSTLLLPEARKFFRRGLSELNRSEQTYLPDRFGNIMSGNSKITDAAGIKKYLNRLLTRSKADNP